MAPPLGGPLHPFRQLAVPGTADTEARPMERDFKSDQGSDSVLYKADQNAIATG